MSKLGLRNQFLHTAIAVCLVFFHHSVSGEEPGRPPLAPHLAGVLNWFPPDTETLHVAQEFEMFAPGGDQTNPTGPGDCRHHCQLSALEGLWQLDDGKYLKPLVGKKVLAAVRGARHFNVVSKFGALSSDGCSVVMFDQDLEDRGTRWTTLLRASARKVVQIQGHEVFAFQSTTMTDARFTPARGQETFLLLLTPKIAMCATSDQYLKEFLNRLDTVPMVRALPDSLDEWQHVDTLAPGWMIRHIPNGLRRTLVGITLTATEDKCQIAYLPVVKSDEDPRVFCRNRWLSKEPIVNIHTPYEFSRSKNGTVVVSIESTVLTENDLFMGFVVYRTAGEN